MTYPNDKINKKYKSKYNVHNYNFIIILKIIVITATTLVSKNNCKCGNKEKCILVVNCEIFLVDMK